MFGELSLEGMISAAFGNATTDSRIELNLTAAESEGIDYIIDDNSSSESYWAQECGIACGNLDVMGIAYMSKETYVWSTEGVGSPKEAWEWIKKMFEQIKVMIVTQFKRIQNFVAGDMKGHGRWAKDNEDKVNEAWKKFAKDVDVKVFKTTSSEFDTVQVDIVDKATEYAGKLNDALKESMKSAEDKSSSAKSPEDEYDASNAGKLSEDFRDNLTLKSIKKRIFGKEDPKKESQKLSEMYETGGATNALKLLTNAEGMKKTAGVSNALIKAASSSVKEIGNIAKKGLEEDSYKDMQKVMKKIQASLSMISGVLIWSLNYKIDLVNITKGGLVKLLNKAKSGDEVYYYKVDGANATADTTSDDSDISKGKYNDYTHTGKKAGIAGKYDSDNKSDLTFVSKADQDAK